MSIKELMKSGTFAASAILLFVVLMPFMIGYLGKEAGLWKTTPMDWLMGFFPSKAKTGAAKEATKVDWEKQLQDLKAFSDWADGLADARISIVRPEEFQIDRVDKTPVESPNFAWKLRCLSDVMTVNATQVRDKLKLICDPSDEVSAEIAAVEALGGGEKGFLVKVRNVRGKGMVGLSYEGLPPVYYEVKLRRLWLVPVASCRSAMRGRYESAVFFPGMDRGLPEGAVIAPGVDKCGYRILSISDHCVWFEAFYGNEPPEDELPHSIWPDFSRVDTTAPTPPPGRLIFGKSRCFWPGDAIKLPNSGWYLMVDDFLAGRAAVFRLLDSGMNQVRALLCVIVREK